MTGIQLFSLVVVFFATSGVSVVTGSTSIITVPVMFQVGMDARVAVATNMFALTFMSLAEACHSYHQVQRLGDACLS